VFYADDTEPYEELTYSDKRLFSAYTPDVSYEGYETGNGWTFIEVRGKFGEAPYPEGYGPEDVAFYRYSIVVEGEGVYYIRNCCFHYELYVQESRFGLMGNTGFNKLDGEGKPLNWEVLEYGSPEFLVGEWDDTDIEYPPFFKSSFGIAPNGGMVKLSQVEYVNGWYGIDEDFDFIIRATIRYEQ
jgi:hypothetical protein